MNADTKVFAGRDVPKGAQSWLLFRPDGERCMAANTEGVQIAEFPIAQLTVENLRATWGAGTYRIQFMGTRKGERRPLGSRIVTIEAVTEVTAPAPASVARTAPTDDPMVRAFQIVDAIAQRAEVAAARDRDFLRAVLEVRNVPPPTPAADPAVSELRAQVATLAGVVQSLVTRLDEPDDDDDDDDDDDEDGRVFRAGEPIKDTAIAEGLNGIVSLVKDLTPALQAYAAAKIQEAAEEIERKKKAASANGAAHDEGPPRLHGEVAAGAG